ncbi:unnamed protein product [Adineta ricciae]|uniref:Uncharacterized protein n=1 Tax=Adineta ricciae TaxID=249248 RepID=A0A813TG63_ADIRI|nr:unnamed protein product [Adineta ricciae]CAF0991019.1 unnamed protein product [Adineta ricciae]
MSTSSDTAEDDRIVAKCYVELGYVTKEKGDFEESLRYHRKSMEIFERIDDPLSVADSHLNIAEIYKAKGELKQAMNEYEIGLSLYEDVYVDEANKNSDSGTDVSLNSSSFCDPLHAKSLSKSEEILPQAILINTIDKDISSSSPRHLNYDRLYSSKSSKNVESMDDSALILSRKSTDKINKSLSSSCASDLQNLDDPDVFLPTTPLDLAYETTNDAAPCINDLLPLLASLQTTDLSTLDTNAEEADNDNVHKNVETKSLQNQNEIHCQNQYSLPKKQFLIIIFVIILTGAFCLSLQEFSSTKSKLKWSSGDSSVYINSRSHQTRDDLGKQLRKLLPWRKSQMASLDQDTRRVVEDFLSSGSDFRSRLTIDKFQKLLDSLDLKIVLVPR